MYIVVVDPRAAGPAARGIAKAHKELLAMLFQFLGPAPRVLAWLSALTVSAALITAPASALANPSSREPEPSVMAEASVSQGSIVDIAVADGRFSTLVTALQTADLVTTLQGAGPFTVFAPTDEAFSELPDGALDTLLADVPSLKNVLLYHVIPGAITAGEAAGLDQAVTAQGSPVAISSRSGQVNINDADVVAADVMASNGVIHVIDSVLIPPAQ